MWCICRTVDSEECFGAANTALLLPNPVCVCLNLLLSISQIQILCKSVGRQQLGSVPLSCAIMGGILRGSRVHITLPHVRQECLVCTHTKVLVIFIVCCCFLRVMFSPLWRDLLFFILCCLALLSLSLSVCGVAVLSIRFKFNLMMILPSSLSVVAFD